MKSVLITELSSEKKQIHTFQKLQDFGLEEWLKHLLCKCEALSSNPSPTKMKVIEFFILRVKELRDGLCLK
jgi:hypothetical protein